MDRASPFNHVQKLLAFARQGERIALDRLLALYRPYLRLAVNGRMPVFLQKRIDGSDIVQHTLIDAQRGLPDFRGSTEAELTAWMTTLLERNLLQSIRRNTAEKRDARREADERLGDGSARLIWHAIAGDGSTPQSGVIRGEAALLLAQALERLADDQRTAIEMRYLGQQSLRAIAEQMQRSVSSVAGLLRRGVEALQMYLPPEFREVS
jgi:RNA polymerase sigma-70 factor (ECF subfamily)